MSQLSEDESAPPKRADYAIVPAILKDAEGIAAVLRASFPGDANYYKVHSWGDEAKRVMRTNKNWLCLVAMSEGEIIGLVACRHLKTKPMPTVRIEWLAVSPDARGMGVGKSLLEAVMQWASESFGEQTVRLTLRARSERQDFYRKMGFRCYGKGWMKMRTD
jgi:GNAT superfamily N-acetyltransferase